VRIRFLCFLTVFLLGLVSTSGAAGHLEILLSTDSVIMNDWVDVWVSLDWDGPDTSADVYLFAFDDIGDFGFLYPGCDRTQPWPTQFIGDVFIPSGATVENCHIGHFPVGSLALSEPFGTHQIGIAITERGTLNVIGGSVFADFDILPSPLFWYDDKGGYIKFEYDEVEGLWALVEAQMGVWIEVDVLYSGHFTTYRNPFISGHWIMGPDWRRSIELSMTGPWYDLISNYMWWFTMTIDVQPSGADMHVTMEHRNRWERGSGTTDSRAYLHHLKMIPPE